MDDQKENKGNDAKKRYGIALLVIVIGLFLGNSIGSRLYATPQDEPMQSVDNVSVESGALPSDGADSNNNGDASDTTGDANDTTDVSNPIVNVAGLDLDPPGVDATDAERGAFATRIQELAVDGKDARILSDTDCGLEPSVLRITMGAEFTIENKTKDAHQLNIGELELSVEAGETGSLAVDLTRGVGIYGVSCDGQTVVGYWDVVPAGTE